MENFQALPGNGLTAVCNGKEMAGGNLAFITGRLAGDSGISAQIRETADRLAEEMMKHTSTLGIRRQEMSRYVLQRDEKTVRTPYGDVRMKVASGMGTERAKPEFDDIAKLATENNVPLRTIRDAIAADRTGKNE